MIPLGYGNSTLPFIFEDEKFVTLGGSVGPSLRQFGKLRGYTVQNQEYAYKKIYDAKAYSLCSTMPRFGTSGTLTEQQIKDLTAYLMDPNSPVNK